jgi:hypothetical protein
MRYLNDVLVPTSDILHVRGVWNETTRSVDLCVQATQAAEEPWVAVSSATEIWIAVQVRLVYLIMIKGGSTVQY